MNNNYSLLEIVLMTLIILIIIFMLIPEIQTFYNLYFSTQPL